jgi:hypothetical protein
LFVVGVVYLSALVTYHAVLSEYFSDKQKAGIIAIAWLLPLLGPIFCLWALADDIAHRTRPGVPLLDFLFLSWVFARASSSGGESAACDVGASHHEDEDET